MVVIEPFTQIRSRTLCLHTTNNLIVTERDHVQTHLCAVSSPTPSLDSTIEQKLLLANNGIEDCQIFIVVGSILGCLLIAASLLMCLLSVRLFKLTKSTYTSHILTNPEILVFFFFETKVVFSMKITAVLKMISIPIGEIYAQIAKSATFYYSLIVLPLTNFTLHPLCY